MNEEQFIKMNREQLYKEIWEVLEGVKHKMDILTALPSHIKREDFLNLK